MVLLPVKAGADPGQRLNPSTMALVRPPEPGDQSEQDGEPGGQHCEHRLENGQVGDDGACHEADEPERGQAGEPGDQQERREQDLGRPQRDVESTPPGRGRGWDARAARRHYAQERSRSVVG